MLEELGEGVLKFEETYVNEQNGQAYTQYRLDRELTETLLTGWAMVCPRLFQPAYMRTIPFHAPAGLR